MSALSTSCAHCTFEVIEKFNIIPFEYTVLSNIQSGFQGATNLRRSNVISPFHLSELVLISLDMQVGQHVETAICPQVLLSEMHTVPLHRNPLQMHLTVLLEALMSYGLHDYNNRQYIHYFNLCSRLAIWCWWHTSIEAILEFYIKSEPEAAVVLSWVIPAQVPLK